MKNNISRRVAIVFLILFIILLFFVVRWPSDANLSNVLGQSYLSLLLLYVFMSIVIIKEIGREKFDIFEPSIILYIAYLLIFCIRPIIDIINDDYYSLSNDNPLDSCCISCILVGLSVVAFMIGKKIPRYMRNKKQIVHFEGKITTAWIIWIVSFSLSVINLVLSGKSLSYIFSFGQNGITEDVALSSSSALLTFFSYSMLAPWVFICFNGKNRIVKIIITILMTSLLFIRGTRIALLAMATSGILFYYLKKRKRPKPITILFAIIGAILILSFVQQSRNATKYGRTIEVSKDTSISNIFDSDLTTYKEFYLIVGAYPKKYNYTMGESIFGQTVTTLIPRFIWKNKPKALITNVIYNAAGSKEADAGRAAPGLAEYYFEFGIVGCLVFMMALGIIFSNWNKLLYENSEYAFLKYAIIYALIIQIIIRTSTTFCVYQYLFSVIPILLIYRKRMTNNG